MTEHTPRISAYCGDSGEEWRILRLDNAWRAIKESQPILSKRVTDMHDHKGKLTIRFMADGINDDQFDAMVNDITAAWNGQNEHEIEIDVSFEWEQRDDQGRS
jgi:hypothetical protein